MSGNLLPIPWLDVVLIVALIALNGVFAMSELAIVSSREARLKAMAKNGSGGAQCALKLAAEPGSKPPKRPGPGFSRSLSAAFSARVPAAPP